MCKNKSQKGCVRSKFWPVARGYLLWKGVKWSLDRYGPRQKAEALFLLKRISFPQIPTGTVQYTRPPVIDDCRRVHNYDEFITTFLTMLAEQNLLGDLVQHGMGYKRLAAAVNATTQGSSGDKEPATTAASSSTSANSSVKKNGGSKSSSAVIGQQPPSTSGQPQVGGGQSSAAAASQPLRGRKKKKKKKYEESESDWSDEDALVPVAKGELF